MTVAVRRLLILGIAMLAVPALAAPAASAQAPSEVRLEGWDVTGTLDVAKSKQTLTMPQGSFDLLLDLTKSTATSTLDLPPGTTKAKVNFGWFPVDATLEFQQAIPLVTRVRGQGSAISLDVRGAFTVRVLKAVWLGANRVGDRCRTIDPMRIELHGGGELDDIIANGFDLEATASIPSFTDCAWQEGTLNNHFAGPGNTLKLHVAPGPDSVTAVTTPTGAPTAELPDDLAITPEPFPAELLAATADPLAGLSLGDLTGGGMTVDSAGPALEVSATRRQRLLRSGGPVLLASCNEDCLLAAEGVLRAGSRSYKLTGAAKEASAGSEKRIKLKLSRAGVRAVRSALKRHKAASVLVKIHAMDQLGNPSAAKRIVVLARR